MQPDDFIFEKFEPNLFINVSMKRKLSSLSRGNSRQILIKREGNESYFLKKEKLKIDIEILREKVQKSKKILSCCVFVLYVKY